MLRDRLNFEEFYSPIMREAYKAGLRSGCSVPLICHDQVLLIGYFAQKHSVRMNKRIDHIPRKTVDALCNYPWPGNVRELENFMERSVILSSGTELQAPLGELKVTTTVAVAEAAPGPKLMEDVERQHIAEILEQTRGVIGGKAERPRFWAYRPRLYEIA